MDELLQLLNRIQEVFTIVSARNGPKSFPFDLPQIVIAGSQSSGKSSVLENLVGRSFLPRGPGIVIRMPLILQLIYCSKKELSRVSNELSCPNLDAWGCFLHKPDRRYTRFDDIKQEILAEALRVNGDQQGTSTEPICLKIYSNSVNLTFVDLPGLITMPVGDQPYDMEQKIRELVLKYMSSPHCIIVAVATANTDITNCETLQLARQIDPYGLRTLLVITKLDLMDEGTDATDILTGHTVPVRLGIIGVVNRSQREIKQGKTISQALIDEANFFKTRYPKFAAKHGTRYLAKTLQRLLIEQINSFLPEIRSTIICMTNHYKSLLRSCGEPAFNKGQTLLNVITDYCGSFSSSIKGNSDDLDTHELCGGARINYIFQETFANALESINPLTGFNRAKILTAMRNASGTCPGLFIPESSFELLVKKQIKQLEEPSLHCADLVYQELERVVINTADKCSKDLFRFYNLHRKILDLSSELIRTHLPDAHNIIRQLIAIQMAYINTNHPDFIKEASVINAWFQSCNNEERQRNLKYQDDSCDTINTQVKENSLLKNSSNKSTGSHCSLPISFEGGTIADTNSIISNTINNNNRYQHTVRLLDNREHNDCVIIEELIRSYFGIVKKSIQDSVPKAIMHFLVNYVIEHLQPKLVSQLYQPEHFDELLTESNHINQKRKETNDIIKVLDKASDIINEIRDVHTMAHFND